jgi:hypothetical protein
MRPSIPFAVAGLLGLTACATWRADTYTLSPAVKESARRYSDVMDDFADQALFANVLRARDYAPMNFNDLSSITGSLSLSGTLALTVPFGPYNGDRYAQSLGANRNTSMPSIMSSTSPVISIGTLNTQGFMMTMIQPISTTYVLSKWDSYPHDLLLYLFVKAIRFPGEEDAARPWCKDHSDPACWQRLVHRNDPDNDDDFQDFQLLVSQMVSTTQQPDLDVGGQVDMRALNLLDPLGDPIPIGRMYTATTPIQTPAPAGSASTPAQAPAHAILSSYSAAQLKAATYFVRITYVTDSGETAASDESQKSLNDGQGLTVQAPQPVATGGGGGHVAAPLPTLYNVYAGYASGTETKQNSKPFTIANPWNEPTNGLVIGSAPPAASGTSYQLQSDYNVFTLINGLSDGQLHVGNAHCPKDIQNGLHSSDLCPPEGKAPFMRFYKEYPAQVVLCIRTDQNGLFKGHSIAPMTDAEKQARQASAQFQSQLNGLQKNLQDLLKQKTDTQSRGAAADKLQGYIDSVQRQITTVASALADSNDKVATFDLVADTKALKTAGGGGGGGKLSGGGGTSGTPPGGSGAPAGGAAPGGGGAAGAGGGTGAMPQVTLALQPSRISAIVHSDSCTSDQMVLKQETEREFDQENAKFTHVEWRSIAEVIQYLGAVARYQKHHETDPSDNHEPKYIQWGDPTKPTRIFTYVEGASGQMTTEYRGHDFTSPMPEPKGTTDYSLQSLALLNELISIAKISGTLPVTQPVQVLP